MDAPLSLARRREVDELLRLAIDRSTDQDVAAFVETGREGLLALRRTIWPAEDEQWRGSYDQADNINFVVASMAARWPAEYLVVFADTRRDRTDTLVLTGLGRVWDPVATARLIGATSGTSWPLRDAAARGLAGRRGDEVERALVILLDDPEYLVRLHAIESLGLSGGRKSLDALQRVRIPADVRPEGMQAAIDIAKKRIESRLDGRPDVLSSDIR